MLQSTLTRVATAVGLMTFTKKLRSASKATQFTCQSEVSVVAVGADESCDGVAKLQGWVDDRNSIPRSPTAMPAASINESLLLAWPSETSHSIPRSEPPIAPSVSMPAPTARAATALGDLRRGDKEWARTRAEFDVVQKLFEIVQYRVERRRRVGIEGIRGCQDSHHRAVGSDSYRHLSGGHESRRESTREAARRRSQPNLARESAKGLTARATAVPPHALAHPIVFSGNS